MSTLTAKLAAPLASRYQVRSVTIRCVVSDDEEGTTCTGRPPRRGHVIVGVQAVATVTLALKACPAGYAVTFAIPSPGVWGVEVASRADWYLADLYAEEQETLRGMLAALGIPPSSVTVEGFKG